MPVRACRTDAISQDTGRFTPSVTNKLQVENSMPNIIEHVAALEFPFFHKKAITTGTKAPVAKKSEPIHETFSISRTSRAIINPNTVTIRLDILPAHTICKGLAFLPIYFFISVR